MSGSGYPKSYHSGIAYLVAHGAHGPKRNEARRGIAVALRELRRTAGRERAWQERYHMYFISGMMPAKEN